MNAVNNKTSVNLTMEVKSKEQVTRDLNIREKEFGNKLIIIEKFTSYILYIYPVLMNCDRKHSFIKETMLRRMDTTIVLMYAAVKTKHKSKLYEIDAMLAALRWYMRLGSRDNIRIFTAKNHRQASILIAEVGKILNSWINKETKNK